MSVVPEVGKRYRVRFEDCCVDGDLIGELLGIKAEEGCEDYPDYIFDFGRIHGYKLKFELWL